MNPGRRVVITGLGIVAPSGADKDQFWQSALRGDAGVSPVPAHWNLYFTPLSKFWSPLPSVDYSRHNISRVERLQLDNVELLSLACAAQALGDAGLRVVLQDEKKNAFVVQSIDAGRWGVSMGTGVGGLSSFCSNQTYHNGATPVRMLTELRAELVDANNAGKALDIIDNMKQYFRMPQRFNPMAVAMIMPNGCSASIGIKYGLTGPNTTFTTACSAGTVAIGGAYRAIVSDECDAMIAGGAEYLGDDLGGCFRGFDIAKTLTTGTDPQTANRPFDRDRSGFLFAEGGAAALILEEKKHASRRGARVYAEITGFCQTFDAYSIMAMDPESKAAAVMLEKALLSAGVDKSEIDYINAHGTGTVLNDETESQLIERMFGKRPFVNSTKSLIGHTIGASGAIEAAVTALSISEQKLHVSKNIVNPVRDLKFVTKTEPCDIRHAISQSFAFGGHNACLVMSRI